MLQIEHISKTYRTGDLVQRALDDVSLCLRDSEFVAILGPSGSGKTTLLNVIGGLDQYDDGELIINGVSTKQYRDRDWDAYRNHSIGFVFQSYNLIPHQSILSNVELALTISGQPRQERRKRAREALEQVGLGDQLHKRPAQLSGGQMQRVAIARALVNDPDILLADEPTGALDSETSLQVMDLLREVAKDRLVVMVTHNPDLATQYATRIVRLRDGNITDDSDPYALQTASEAAHRSLGRASMSFLTAIALSFNNLRTKLGRTLLTAFAGSIGIIGIALILSMSNGIQTYIRDVEENTLREYPLEITDTSFNMSTLFTQPEASTGSTADVVEWQTVSKLLTRVSANDLQSLRGYLESDESTVYDNVQAIEYSYGVVPQIYQLRDGKLRQVNPDNSFAAMGFSSTENAGGLFSAFSSTDTFRPMPSEASLYTGQYDLKAGHWPQDYNECALVLTSNGRVADITLYVLGLKDPEELDALVQSFAAGESADVEEAPPGEYRYEDFLGIEFQLVHSADYYVYDKDFGVWTDRSGDQVFLRRLIKTAEPLTIVGVVQPKGNSSSGCLTPGICYHSSLTTHLMEYAANSPIVRAQLAEPGTNVFTGTPFGEEADAETISLESLFSVDEEMLKSMFQFDAEDLQLDFTGMDFSDMDMSDFDLTGMEFDTAALGNAMPSISMDTIGSMLQDVEFHLTQEQLTALFNSLLDGYLSYISNDPSTDFSQLPASFQQYLQSDTARSILNTAFSEMLAQAGAAMITPGQLGAVVDAVMDGYPGYLAANGIDPEAAGAAELARYLSSDVAQAIVSEIAANLRAQLAGFVPTQAQLSSLASALYSGYQSYAAANHLPDPSKLSSSLAGYLNSPAAQSLITRTVASAIDTSALEQRAASLISGYAGGISSMIQSMIGQAAQALGRQISNTLQQKLSTLADSLEQNLQSAFEVDPTALAEAFTMNMDVNELRDLMTTLLSGTETSYRGNLRKLGYAELSSPSSISIYPLDFDGKREVKRILEDYNDRQRADGNEDGVIVYSDMVDTLMRSVTEIIDAVSIVLIAFVAVSLVVSSIMIGIITYISVLERTKEIGILRAMGASKRNISQVFNAETFLVGLCAGVIGVGMTLLLLIPINILLPRLSGVDNVRAILPLGGALILVVLSMFLTIAAGLIPSKKAAKKDPVAALRTE